MKAKPISARGVELYSESFGNPENPALLLLMGATASAVWWPEEFCRDLAARGRYVIRYDHRDTGRSTKCPPGEINYTVEDLADDAVSVLSGHGIARAHLVGMSLGGFLVQLVALKYPEKVLSLTLIASEPLGPGDPDIPPIDDRVIAHHMKAANLDWSNRELVIEHSVEGWRLLSGSAHPFDEKGIRTLAEADFERTENLLTSMNHGLLSGGEGWFGRLGEIRVPTLVIHGTEDPVLNYAHGRALAKAIPGAFLLSLNGTGHELHRNDWPAILGALENHTAPKA